MTTETTIATLYYADSIRPASGGFGLYESGPNALSLDEGYADLADVVPDGAVLLEDGADLPEGAEDIRGRIQRQPTRVYVTVDDDGRATYHGVWARQVVCNSQGDAVAWAA
jgi:hypothetical protein